MGRNKGKKSNDVYKREFAGHNKFRVQHASWGDIALDFGREQLDYVLLDKYEGWLRRMVLYGDESGVPKFFVQFGRDWAKHIDAARYLVSSELEVGGYVRLRNDWGLMREYTHSYVPSFMRFVGMRFYLRGAELNYLLYQYWRRTIGRNRCFSMRRSLRVLYDEMVSLEMPMFTSNFLLFNDRLRDLMTGQGGLNARYAYDFCYCLSCVLDVQVNKVCSPLLSDSMFKYFNGARRLFLELRRRRKLGSILFSGSHFALSDSRALYWGSKSLRLYENEILSWDERHLGGG